MTYDSFPTIFPISRVDYTIISIILSPPLAPLVRIVGPSLDPIFGLDFSLVFVGLPTPNFLLMDLLLAPSFVVFYLPSSVLHYACS